MTARILTAIAAATVSLALGACGEERQSLPTGEEIRIVGTEMAFSPKALTTAKGRHSIVFTNDGDAYHELAVASPGGSVLAARSIPAGGTVAFDVELGRPGIYQLLCREPGHTKAGMVGTLTVTG